MSDYAYALPILNYRFSIEIPGYPHNLFSHYAYSHLILNSKFSIWFQGINPIYIRIWPLKHIEHSQMQHWGHFTTVVVHNMQNCWTKNTYIKCFFSNPLITLIKLPHENTLSRITPFPNHVLREIFFQTSLNFTKFDLKQKSPK